MRIPGFLGSGPIRTYPELAGGTTGPGHLSAGRETGVEANAALDGWDGRNIGYITCRYQRSDCSTALTRGTYNLDYHGSRYGTRPGDGPRYHTVAYQHGAWIGRHGIPLPEVLEAEGRPHNAPAAGSWPAKWHSGLASSGGGPNS